MHKNTLFSSFQNNFSQKISQKLFFLTFFLIIFIFSAFFSSNFAFADSKKTNVSGDNYSTTKNYSANDTIRISTNTSVANNAVKVDGFFQDENEKWVSDVFTDTDALNIITIFEIKGANTGNTVTETITASGDTALRLRVEPFNVAGGNRKVWYGKSGVGLYNIKNLSDIFTKYFELNNYGYNGVYIEAKVEAVCSLPDEAVERDGDLGQGVR